MEMPALVRLIPGQDANKKGTDPVFSVVLLDETCPLKSSGLNTQVFSIGLSTETLKRS
jgi:hypothetical protein